MKANHRLMKKIFKTPIDAFEELPYGLQKKETSGGLIYHKDNGSKILAVAHLDSVCEPKHFAAIKMPHRELVFSPVLDDRLGVYTILDLLPQAGINADILFTEGEERGRSTAQFFETEKKYNWMVEFDRMGSDVVTYQYTSVAFKAMLEKAGFKVGSGTYSDIADLEHLGCCGVNIGVGYHEYHSIDAYAEMGVVYANLVKLRRFYDKHYDTFIEHVPAPVIYKYDSDYWARHWGYNKHKSWANKGSGKWGAYIDCAECQTRFWEDECVYREDYEAFDLGVCPKCYEESFSGTTTKKEKADGPISESVD